MYKVLLVDDEILVREAISENLKWNDLGYELVGTCKNGNEAKQYIESNEVDVVLTDICMPGVDGIELSEYIYSNFPDISIIIFSGFAEFEYAQKAIKYNVEEYMLKPVTAAELSKTLTDVKSRRDKKRKTMKKLSGVSVISNKNKKFIQTNRLSAKSESTNTRRASLAMDYLEKNYSDSNLSLSEVCSYLNISSSRFSTVFKKETGETFNEALTRIRIDKAKNLIEYYDIKNYEIAEKVGFSDPHYFSVVFKKMTGQSPTEYKKEINDIL